MERTELPDPAHVLGTVDNAADAFRMSNQLRDSVLLDDIEADAADPVAPSSRLRADPEVVAAGAGARPGGRGVDGGAAASLGGGSGGPQTLDSATHAVGASNQEVEGGAGAEMSAADVGAEGETCEVGGLVSMHEAAARDDVDRVRNAWNKVTSGPLAMSRDVDSVSLPGPLPEIDVAVAPRVVAELQHAVLRPPAATTPPPGPAPPPPSPPLLPPPSPTAMAGAVADDPEVAAAARRGALVAAAMQSGVPAAGDTGEELRRLRQIVARLASHLDNMLAVHAREQS